MSSDADRPLTCRVEVGLAGFRLDVDLDLSLSGVTGLFGPSGSGKSTLLRTIAGFERSARGLIRFGQQAWLDTAGGIDLPAWRRPAGFVFQDARLFSHLDVLGNLRFAQARARGTRPVPFDDVVERAGLASLLSRRPASLSGGERQRVAIARALLSQPALLLLDEPLASLDHAGKQGILPYLDGLWRRFGIPLLYVSHAADEVARLCDSVIVLQHGKVIARGPSARTLNEVSGALGSAAVDAWSVVEAVVQEHDTGLGVTRAELGGQSVYVPLDRRRRPGDLARLFVRAGDVAIALEPPGRLSIRNVIRAEIADIETEPDGTFATVTLDVSGATLRSRVTRHALRDLALREGMSVYALLKTASLEPHSP